MPFGGHGLTWEHPRIHGEDNPASPRPSTPLGTPPHTWGRHWHPENMYSVGTPPYIWGILGRCACTIDRLRNTPRTHREDAAKTLRAVAFHGTPPCVRGIQCDGALSMARGTPLISQGEQVSTALGLTTAKISQLQAGNMATLCCYQQVAAEHSHALGE